METGVGDQSIFILGGAVVTGTCRPYMSSLKHCNQTKYDIKQTLLWRLYVSYWICCVLYLVNIYV
jgi:hypothetical protein